MGKTDTCHVPVKIKAAGNISEVERHNLRTSFNGELEDWAESLMILEDGEDIRKTKKMNIYLEDIPFPSTDDDDLYAIKNSHYRSGPFGSTVLCPESRNALRKRMRERKAAPAFWFS